MYKLKSKENKNTTLIGVTHMPKSKAIKVNWDYRRCLNGNVEEFTFVKEIPMIVVKDKDGSLWLTSPYWYIPDVIDYMRKNKDVPEG